MGHSLLDATRIKIKTTISVSKAMRNPKARGAHAEEAFVKLPLHPYDGLNLRFLRIKSPIAQRGAEYAQRCPSYCHGHSSVQARWKNGWHTFV